MYHFTNDAGDKLTAVLYSPGFGAGWSTWGSPRMATDPALIQYLLDKSDNMVVLSEQNEDSTLRVGTSVNVKEFTDIVMDMFPNAYISRSNTEQLTIGFVPQGSLFRINEYDGSESIEVFSTDGWTRA